LKRRLDRASMAGDMGTPSGAAPHFLDDFDYGHPEAIELRSLFARAYTREQDITALLARAGIDAGYVNLAQAPIYVWHDALRQAADALLLRPLLDLVLGDDSRKKYHGRLRELMQSTPVIEAPSGGCVGGPGPAEGDVERILGSASTLVDIGVLEGALRVAPAVAHLRVSCGAREYYGTGFLVDAPGAPLVLTNHHVLFDWTAGERRASKLEAWFSYETGPSGPKPVSVVHGDPATIVGQRDLDWAAFRLVEPVPDTWPHLPLKPSRPPEIDALAFIIQHPGGRMKQIGLTRNQVQLVDDRVVQYLTDTEAGSSGSPVFDDRWEVIALHHSWVQVAKTEGRPPAYRNEGIRIERVREGLVAAGVLPSG
jgi:hypothetical protein